MQEEWHEVAHWYRMAAKAGHPAAAACLAELYEGGRGVPRDPAKALKLYRRALAAGYVDAASQVQRIEAEFRRPPASGG
jgi:hypothetical protein